MSIIKKPYEISIWDNIWSDGKVTEKKVAIIGSDTMTAKWRAVEPQLVTNVNGTVTFTFKIYTQYFDSEKNIYLENPIIPYLVNERLVKVKYDGKWYDLVIKNVVESSDQKSFTYTCKSLHISELSKTGFNLEFKTELENNMGTITELAERVVEGTDWTIDKVHSDIIRAYKPEQIFTSTLQANVTAKVMLDKKDTQLFNGTTLYFFYSSLQSYQETRELQVLTGINSDSDIVIDDDGIIISDLDDGKIQNALITLTPTITATQLGLDNYKLSPYKAYKLVKQKQQKYDNKTDRYVEIGKDNDGKTVYKYTETEYLTPTFVKNLIANPSDFSSTAGWNVVDTEHPLTLDIATGGQGDNYAALEQWNIQNNPDGSHTVIIPTDEEMRDIKSYLHVGGLKEAGAKETQKIFYNNGITANRTHIKNFTKGENYALLVKGVFPDINTDNMSQFFDVVVSKNGETSNPIFSTKSQSPKITSNPTSDSKQWIYKLSCLRSIPEIELSNSTFRISFVCPITSNEYYLEDVEFFKWFDSPKNSNVCLLPLDGAAEDWVPKDWVTDESVYADTKKYAVNYDYYYYPEDNIDATTPEEIQYQQPNGYTPLYNDENGYQKITSIDVSESNRFNIIQTLCENFECWANFIIDHDGIGRITSRRIVFKEYIGDFNYAGFKYGINLQSIQRTVDSEQISTKVIVKDNTNEHATDGFCTISRARDNPTGQNFLLDFSYYIRQGLLDESALNEDLYVEFNFADPKDPDLRVSCDKGYYIYIHDLVVSRDSLIEQLSDLKISQLSAQSDVTAYEQEIEAINEELSKLYNQYMIYTGVNFPAYVPVPVIDPETGEPTKDTDSRDTDPTFIQYVTNIAHAKKKYAIAEANLEQAKARLRNVDYSISTTTLAIKKQQAQIEELNNGFFTKYQKFIQEGSWTSQDYYNDDMYYWDALDVARTSAKPKVTYTISVIDISALPDYSAYAAHIGDRTTIEDTEFFGYVTKQDSSGNVYKEPYKEEIVVTELTSNFDSPEQDEIKVQNYKTQFDDLFQRVVATSQALQYASGSYQRAANAILEGKELRHDYLQNAIDRNAIILRDSVNESVVWDNTGITITDTTNSAYILRLVSRGLMLSADGGETWVTGIRGDGINADYITSGRLDTGKITIVTRNMETFTWDSYGITAYRWDNERGLDRTQFIRFDQYGIYCLINKPDFNIEAYDNGKNGLDKVKALSIRDNPFYLLRDGSLRVKGDIYANSLTLGGKNGEDEDYPIVREDTMYALFKQQIEDYNFDDYIKAEPDEHGLVYGKDTKVTDADKTQPYWSYTQPPLTPDYALIQRHRVFKFDGKNSFESFYTDLTSTYSKINNNMLRGTADPVIQTTNEADNWILGQWRINSAGNGEGSKASFGNQGENVAPFPGLEGYLQIEGNSSGNRDFIQHPIRGLIKDKLYTISLYAKVKTKEEAGKVTLLVRLWNQTQGSGNDPMYEYKAKDLDTTWKLYYSTFKYSLESSDTHISAQFGIESAGSIQLCGFKLEPGRVQTPQWTPSPYDLDHRVISTVYHYYSAKRNEDGTFNKPNYNSTGWTETLPTLSANDPIIWCYFEQTYEDGTTYRSEIYVLSTYGRDGTNGKNGSPGKDGKTITDIKQYFFKSKTKPEKGTSGWTTQIPTGIRDDDTYWTYVQYTYNDGTSTTSDVVAWDAQQFYEDLMYSGSLVEYDENGKYIRGSYDPLLAYKEETMSYMGADVPVVVVYKKGDPSSETQWRVRRQGLVIGDNAVILGTILASNGIFVGDVHAKDLTIERGLSVGAASTKNLLQGMDTTSIIANETLDMKGTDHTPKKIEETKAFTTPYPSKFGETYIAGDDYTYDHTKGNDDRKKYVVYYNHCEKSQVETFIYTRHTDSPVNKHAIYQLEFKVKVSATPMHYSVRVVYYSIENSKVKLLHEDPVTILEEDTTNYIPDRWVTKKVAFTTEEGSKPNHNGSTQVETSTDWAAGYTYIGFRFDNDGIIRDDYTTTNTTHTTLRICDLKLTEGAFGLDKNGTLVAKSGYIGGWNIGNKKLYASYYDPADDKSYVSAIQAPQPGSPEWVFAAGGTGHNSYADALFRVNKKGQLWATGAHISGTIICGNDSTFGGKKPATWEDSINGATNTANGANEAAKNAQTAAKNAQSTAESAKNTATNLNDDYTKFLSGSRGNLLPLGHPFKNDVDGYEKGGVSWSRKEQTQGFIRNEPQKGFVFVLEAIQKNNNWEEASFGTAAVDLPSTNTSTTYTFSISLRCSGTSGFTSPINFTIAYYLVESTVSEQIQPEGIFFNFPYASHQIYSGSGETAATTTWQRIAVSFQVSDTKAKSILFEISQKGANNNASKSALYIAHMQLEVGNTAGEKNKALTPFSPCPNDPYVQANFLSLGGVLITDESGLIIGHAQHITYEDDPKNSNNIILHYRGTTSYDATVSKDGLIVCDNMVVLGTIFSSQGRIGGWTIEDNNLSYSNYKVGVSPGSNLIGDGNLHCFWAGYSKGKGEPPFYVLDNGSLHATQATIKGTITTNSGKIGGWTITNGKLYATSANNEVCAVQAATHTWVFAAGGSDHTNYSTCPFRVDNSGNLYATNAHITGSVRATSGSFGGLEIGQITVSTGNSKATINALRSFTDEKGFKMILYPQGYSLTPWGTYGRNFLNVGKKDIFSDPNTDACISDIGGVITIYTPTLIAKNIQCSNFYMYNNDSSQSVTLKVSRKVTDQFWGYTYISGGEPATNGHQDRYGGIYFGWTNSNPVLSNTNNHYCKIVDYTNELVMTHKQTVYISTGYKESGSQTAINIASDSGSLNGTWKLNGQTAVSSDYNLKHSISFLPNSYSTLFDNLKPVLYKYNDGQSDRFHTGFIAQDVEQAILNAGLTTQDFAGFVKSTEQIRDPNNPENLLDETRDVYYLRYGEFVALNTYEIQKLKKRIIELENHISALENRAF